MRVSILINNYNYERFVGVAVESALRQTHPDVEVIVVDDGSSDASLQVLQQFDSVTLVAKANGGQASAYNEGFRRSSGDIVIFLDADDWLFANAAERLVAAWQPGVTKIQFPLELVGCAGNSLGRRVPHDMSDVGALGLLKNFGCYNSPPGSGNAYDAQFLRKIMPIDESRWRIAADTVPIMLAPAYGQIMSLSNSLGAYRRHSDGADALLMNNAPADLWDEYRRISASKAFVAHSLRRLGIEHRAPLWLAPWEARIVALCVRFGEPAAGNLVGSRFKLGWFALVSLWRWPDWRWSRKALQTIWMLLVFFTPASIARNLALRYKTSVGAPAQMPV